MLKSLLSAFTHTQHVYGETTRKISNEFYHGELRDWSLFGGGGRAANFGGGSLFF